MAEKTKAPGNHWRCGHCGGTAFENLSEREKKGVVERTGQCMKCKQISTRTVSPSEPRLPKRFPL